MKKYFKIFIIQNIFLTFAMHWFATSIRRKQLKGNQVQILDSPAAVSFIKCY